MRTDCEVHTTDTEDITHLGKLVTIFGYADTPEILAPAGMGYQHLHLVSNRAILKGDWFLCLYEDESYMDITQFTGDDFSTYADSNWTDECRKLEASTDPQYGLPLVPQSFVKFFALKMEKKPELVNVIAKGDICFVTYKDVTYDKYTKDTERSEDEELRMDMSPEEAAIDILSKGGTVKRENMPLMSQATWDAFERGFLRGVLWERTRREGL